mmetsp:Transcript_4715/g.11230  ORF Transcript_4715/g.11230 Transcript_4715/m.11230 type:complete len:236 (-) Transcript_4715:1279-1986(-)
MLQLVRLGAELVLRDSQMISLDSKLTPALRYFVVELINASREQLDLLSLVFDRRLEPVDLFLPHFDLALSSLKLLRELFDSQQRAFVGRAVCCSCSHHSRYAPFLSSSCADPLCHARSEYILKLAKHVRGSGNSFLYVLLQGEFDDTSKPRGCSVLRGSDYVGHRFGTNLMDDDFDAVTESSKGQSSSQAVEDKNSERPQVCLRPNLSSHDGLLGAEVHGRVNSTDERSVVHLLR